MRLLAFLQTEMSDVPTLSYTSSSEIPIVSYTRGPEKGTPLGQNPRGYYKVHCLTSLSIRPS